MGCDRKCLAAVWPLAAAAACFAFGSGAFPQSSAGTDDLPLLLNARMALHGGKLEPAERDVRQYLAKHPNSADAHYMLGFILFREIQASSADQDLASRANKARASLAEYTEAAKYHTPSYLDLKIVALDYVLLEDYPDADKWLSHSLQWNPEDAEGWYDLGRIKYSESSFAAALSAFDRCLKLDAGNVKAEDNLGLTYAKLGRTNEAISAFQSAIAWQGQLPDKDAQPYIDLGSFLIDRNRPQEAIVYLAQATKIAPGNDKAHKLLDQAQSLASAQK
jgi:tetratricopeptide (TPR) repeat protein